MSGARKPLEMPDRLAVFPLTGVVLMPFGHLPLNIFEPRYLNMIDDALGQNRIIAMVQPRGNPGDPVPHDVPLYDVATAGRIIQFQDPGDGRYLITLEGLSRLRIAREVEPAAPRGYRQVEADFTPFAADVAPLERTEGQHRKTLLDLMKRYFEAQEIDADWNAVSEAPYDALISSLTMSCPFSPEEKQALLESPTHEARADMLISLFQMNTADGFEPSSARKH